MIDNKSEFRSKRPNFISLDDSSSNQTNWSLDNIATTTTSKNLFDKIKTKSSLSQILPYHMNTNCCVVEYNSYSASEKMTGSLNLGVESFHPSLSDVLIISGTITIKYSNELINVYNLMPKKKWVVCFGGCSCSGGPYRSSNIVNGVGELFPVDIFIPGCPPTPEALTNGLMKLKQRILLGVCAANV